MPQATLVNRNTGQRVAVEVGSQDAQRYFGQGYVLEGARTLGSAPAPTTPSGTRDLNITPPSSLQIGQGSSPTPTTFGSSSTGGSAYSKFGTQLMQLLQQQQQLGTKGFAEQGFNAQEEQVKRIQSTPENLIGAAPNIQAGARNDAASALNPTIQGAQNSQRTFSEQIAGLGNAISQAKGIGEWMQGVEQQQQQDARDLIFNLPSTVKQLPDDQKRELEKRAGLQKGLIDLLPDTAKDLKTEVVEAGGRKLLINSSTGETIRDLGEASSSLDNGLTPNQINSTVNSIASAFDNEPIVKNYNTVQEGYQTLQTIGVETKSPADDIAFIYGFAKIMDPNSVVREGEYNTVQRYAQTWADNFGFNAKRVFSNTNFLTADAKQKMLNALKPKVDTITNQYTNLKSEYQRQIDDAYSGKPRSIQDYSAPFSGQDNKTGEKPVPGASVQGGKTRYFFSNGDFVDLTPQQFQEDYGNTTAANITIPKSSRLAYVNNNPGNLRFVGQKGATKGENGFAKFSSPQAGYEALKSQIKLDASRGLSLKQFVYKYAPPSENDSGTYLKQMVSKLRVHENAPLGQLDLDALARAVAEKESSTKIYA